LKGPWKNKPDFVMLGVLSRREIFQCGQKTVPLAGERFFVDASQIEIVGAEKMTADEDSFDVDVFKPVIVESRTKTCYTVRQRGELCKKQN
jgi:hypothetical protein